MLSLFYPTIIVLVLQNVYITNSSTWSAGTYALLKPTSGCPTGWKEEGHLQQITGSNNDHSKILHIQGGVYSQNVSRYFCIKKIPSRPWPKGQYCIYGKQANWRYTGYIRMYSNHGGDYFSNVSPFVRKYWSSDYGRVMVLYFSCQKDGDKKVPISLPITKPFYLLPYGSRDCQQVQWMVATTEWIKYDTEIYNGIHYKYYRNVPHHELKKDHWNTGIKMYYCYYESCNYTLSDKSGRFQFPSYPGKYPDGQLCSWRIVVPKKHTLHVHFTHYSLYEYDKDCLQLYENNNGIFKPRQTFFGYQEPFNITANNELIFVFRSDEENNSTGFKAQYEVVKIPERTTTTKPPTTTTPPPTTTTPQPTTQPTTTKQPTTTQATDKQITTEETTFEPTPANSTTNETLQCNPTSTKNKSYDKHSFHPLREKTCFCDETWKIVVMVIPLAVLIVLVSIDIFCRCRSKRTTKSGTTGSSANDEMVVNPMYERGNIILDQPADTVTEASTAPNTIDDQPQSRDEPPDYEDVDYTQLNEVPPPRRSSKRQECHALESINANNSAVFYHVLEPPNTDDSVLPKSHVAERVGSGAPDVFYHTLERPTDSTTPAYQNLSEVNQYTLNPLYEASQTSAPFAQANRLYDNYLA